MCLYVFQVQLCMFLMDMAGTLAAAFTEGGLGAGGGQSFARGGGGVWNPKSPKVCVPKTVQINISLFANCIFSQNEIWIQRGEGCQPPPPPAPQKMLSSGGWGGKQWPRTWA